LEFRTRTVASLGTFARRVRFASRVCRCLGASCAQYPLRDDAAACSSMPSADKAGGQACVAACLFGLLLIVVAFTQGFAVAYKAQTVTHPPPPPVFESPRRALRQISLERDLVPGGYTGLAPGTSGASPNTWLRDAYVSEVPFALKTQASVYASNALDRSARNFDRFPSAAFEAWGALLRYAVVGGVNSNPTWLVPPTLWPSLSR